jgi:hypothetical protein
MQCMQCMMDEHKQCARSMMHDPHIHTFTNRIMIANSRLGVCVCDGLVSSPLYLYGVVRDVGDVWERFTLHAHLKDIHWPYKMLLKA